MTTTATATAPATRTRKASETSTALSVVETPPTPAKALSATSVDAVLERMRDLHDEADRWKLADELLRQIPSGGAGFAEIIAKASEQGVAGNLKEKSLQLYRDTATHWPTDQRVKGVTFTAHREAKVVGDTKTAHKLLTSLVKQHGVENVSVTRVRDAVRTAKGAPARRSSSRGSANKVPAFDVLADVKDGASQLIASIGSDTDADSLDKLHAGLTKAIGHVERLRVKAARKASAANKASAPVAKQAAKKATSDGRKAGDMRGLR
jgi:hypothetical protein